MTAGVLLVVVTLWTGPIVYQPSDYDIESLSTTILDGRWSMGASATPERKAIARHQALTEVVRQHRAIEALAAVGIVLCGGLFIVSAIDETERTKRTTPRG